MSGDILGHHDLDEGRGCYLNLVGRCMPQYMEKYNTQSVI